jgi:hypothetical protein
MLEIGFSDIRSLVSLVRVINKGHMFLVLLVIRLKATTTGKFVSGKRKQLKKKNVYKPIEFSVEEKNTRMKLRDILILRSVIL